MKLPAQCPHDTRLTRHFTLPAFPASWWHHAPAQHLLRLCLLISLTALFSKRPIINLPLSVLLKSCYILQSAVEHSCIPAAAPCSVLQCLNAAATLRLIAGLLHRHCTIATLQGPAFYDGRGPRHCCRTSHAIIIHRVIHGLCMSPVSGLLACHVLVN